MTSYTRLFYQGSKENIDEKSDGNGSEGDAAGAQTQSEQNNQLTTFNTIQYKEQQNNNLVSHENDASLLFILNQ